MPSLGRPLAALAMAASIVFGSWPARIAAQQGPPDFSGRWRLVAPPEGGTHVASSAALAAADEVIVSQDAMTITVEDRPVAEHPRAGTHRLGSRGIVGGEGASYVSHVFWFGDQLIVSSITKGPADAEGRRRTDEYGEMWFLDGNGRLVIRVSEKPAAGKPVAGTLVYRKR